MKKRIITILLSATIALGASFASTAAAFAKDYYESPSGNTGFINNGNQTNTLYYKKAHGSFNLRIYVSTYPYPSASDKYSIKMYDNSGRCLWSAVNQRDRTYYVGGNVTKIVLATNSPIGPTLNWQKK